MTQTVQEEIRCLPVAWNVETVAADEGEYPPWVMHGNVEKSVFCTDSQRCGSSYFKDDPM